MDRDYIVLGCGPAGLQMTYHMKKYGMDFLTLEKSDHPGSFFSTHPRHRTLISINKKWNLFPEDEYNMRHDWNSLVSDDPEMRFTKYTDELFPHTDLLVKYMADYAERFGLNEHIKYNTTIKKISKSKETGRFTLATESGETYTCKYLVMATGACAEKLPKVPGVELVDTYAKHTLDTKEYQNKAVAIIGGGNSAFEVGNHIAGAAGFVHYIFRQPYCKLAWDTHFVGDVRAINNSVIDMYHLKSLHAFRSANITAFSEAKGEQGGLLVHMDIEMPHWTPPGVGHFKGRYDKVIVATGWNYIDPTIFDPAILPETRLDMKFPVLDEMWQTSVENMYYIGTTSQSRDRKAASGFIHGFRYTSGTLCNLLQLKNGKVDLPKEVFPKLVLDDLCSFVIKRVSTVSALYQMNQGVLCDIIIFRDNRASKGPKPIKQSDEDLSMTEESEISIEYIYEVPSAWAKMQKNIMNNDLVWIVSLGDSRQRYPHNVNPTAFSKPPDLKVDSSDCSGFMEPRFECFKQGKPQGMLYMGGSVIVRHDVSQLPGGNADKSKNKMKNWVNDQLNLGYPKYDTSFYSEEMWPEVFTYWTESQVNESMEKKKMKLQQEVRCPMSKYDGLAG